MNIKLLRSKSFAASLISLSIILLIPLSVTAAIPTGGQVNPGRVKAGLPDEPTPRVTPVLPSITLPKEPKTRVEAEKLRFQLLKLGIYGNTVFSNAELQYMFKEKIGTTITIAQLRQMARQITLKYRKAGYLLSQAIAPPQRIEQGVAKIQIIEGHIHQVRVEGEAEGYGLNILEGYGRKIAAERPMQAKTLEHYALLANDLPGLTVKTVLAPSRKTPGAADLTFVVKRNCYDAYISYDNKGTNALGPQQLEIGSYANTYIFGGRTGVRATSAMPMQELRFIEFSHQQPIGYEGLNIFGYFDYVVTEPADELSPLEVQGRSTTLALTASMPMLRTRRENLFVRLTLDWNDNKQDVIGGNLFNDRIRSLRLGTTLDVVDRWRGINLVHSEISQGFNIFGASKEGFGDLSRPGGKVEYTKINVDFSRLQLLPRNYSILLAGKLQYGFDDLLSVEEFGFGGTRFGRGYDPSEIIGDHGASGKIEVRMDEYPNEVFLSHLQAFVFYDIGKVWNRNKDSQPGQETAASAGFGARIDFNSFISGDIYVAKPLTRKVDLEDNRDARVYFSIKAQV